MTRNYYQFAESRLAKVIHRLPHPIIRFVFKHLGRRRFFDNYEFISDQILETGIASSAAQAEEIKTGVFESDALNFADLGLMMHGSEGAIKRNLTSRMRVESSIELSALAETPHIILGAQFANFQLCAFAFPELKELTVVRRFNSGGRDALSEKISKLSKKSFDTLGSTDDDIGIQLIKRLRAGRSIAVMIDFFYADTSLFLPQFMGRHCATPAGIFVIAAQMKVPVVMINVVREGSDFVVHISEPIPLPEVKDPTARAYQLSEKANELLEAFVRKYPKQWTFWPVLAQRWSYADRALAIEAVDANE